MIKLNDWVKREEKKHYQDYVFAVKLLDYTIVLSCFMGKYVFPFNDVS